MPSLAAASAPASVEFVSPKTRTASGRSASEDRLQRDEHPARLLAAAAAADPEAVVGPRQAELGEERAGHRLVVVLAGVDEDLVVARPQRRLQRRQP